MLASLFTKTLYDQRRGLLGGSVSLVLLVGMYVALWPSLRDQPSMSDFLKQMPEAFRYLFAATGADMSTPVGYVQVELLSFMGPIAVLVYAIGVGVAVIGGEEDHHTMDLLLANPVGRTRVVLEKFTALALGTFLLAAVTGVSLVGLGSFADMNLPAGDVAAAMLHLALLGVVFGALALTLSASTGRTGLSRGIPAVVAVVAYVVNALAPLVDWLDPFQKLSPYYQYIGHDPLREGVDGPSVLVAVATVAVLLGLAVLGFRRRDIAA
ncbi:ABC transporter permease [Cryobacterium sp. TMT1-21]|uniref:ABC transporter permease subunit n=1 Tax=unclassified Cryobacterium TaxID=2649013 RepID=UPI00106DA54C|nr:MULTISPECIES: ABC transporter permease subunit [unclassified Cryobacterium]TFD14699.1 ABC transporter permease [Cryobacterium sp. TMT1-21]TFD40927.1 ABC transporter permease [Cryobacterium sp. TMT2-10]